MKPLSEEELGEKIDEYVDRFRMQWVVEGDEYHQSELIEDIVQLIIQDRKAWGEYVIGEDIDFPRDSQTGAPVGTDGFIGLGKSELRAEQRQRNQGEKTDE